MTEPTWTPWLDNPGTGENPVPEFAVEFEVMLSGKNDTYVNGCWDCSSTPEGAIPITRYRYSIPADLAWLAKNLSQWSKYRYWSVPDEKRVYTKPQWLRARRDLGYESGTERFGRICAGEVVNASQATAESEGVTRPNWVTHHGRGRPEGIDPNQWVVYQTRSAILAAGQACDLDWCHEDHPDDIMVYTVIEQNNAMGGE